ncbi:MAG: DUF4288 domain-containing protein [Proteobacteria bacterium]|nr:DUF4288 domain-containing protein [Pseudomonadota bacterium]
MSDAADDKMQDDCVFLVRAHSFEDAFRKFLTVGRSKETSYRNEEGHDIKVLHAEILTMDRIGQDLDGAEAHSDLQEIEGPEITFETPIDPARSRPDLTM